ncbi:MAG: 6-phosphogluconolactonase [Parafilimonas sp.]|nr:6-phosphogluconolactonase [Parafilimonas sp.]
MELHVCKNYNELSEHIADWMVEYLCKTLAMHERFSIALTGGNTPKKLYEILASDEYKNKIDWSRANIFIGDERFVPFNDDKSNAKMIRETLLDHVSVDEAHVHFMQTENMSPETAANAYEEVLEHYFNKNTAQSTFDLVLLGMGDDAHTLSLFPGQKDAINEQTKWCTYLWVEQQNMHRITLTAPVINASKQVAFLISGESKSSALNYVLHKKYDPLNYPSQIIKPANGELHFFVDEAAMNG